MLKHHLKIAFRHLFKNKIYTAVNVSGLAVGIACFGLIFLYLHHELNYDTFHQDKDRIYRVGLTMKVGEKVEMEGPITMAPLGPTIQRDLAEVEDFVRLGDKGSGFLRNREKTINEENIFYADSSFFRFFSFHLLSGDPRTALREPGSIVLSAGTATRLFGSENPLGQVIRLDNQKDLMVTGVAEDPPENSHIKYHSLISFASLYDGTNCMKWDCNIGFYTYIKLFRGASPASLESKFADFMWPYINQKYAQFNGEMMPSLQPLTTIHLHSHSSYELEPPGSLSSIYVFSAIALFILLIACVNFMNLTTARSAQRAREVGLRKISGAGRVHLAGQFLGESFLLSSAAAILGVLLMELLLPAYNHLLGQQLTLAELTPGAIAIFAGIVLGSGLLAGLYPAVYLVNLLPMKILKAGARSRSTKSAFRNGLVVFQFVISIALISSTLIISSQLKYMQNKELGFDRENILVVPLTGTDAREDSQVIKTAFLQIPGVLAASASSDIPGRMYTSNGYVPEGYQDPFMFNALAVDYDYLSTMGMQLVAGREFSPEFSTDKDAYLINESLARKVGWDNAVGKRINRNGDHQVIGVVRDFNFLSLHQQVPPLIIHMQPYKGYSYLSLRVRPQVSGTARGMSGLLSHLEQTWQSILPDEPFQYHFLEQNLDRMYRADRRLGQLFLYFTGLAIFIACLGLFGLATHTAEMRTKEIGIRKALGASVPGVVMLLSGEFTRRVLVANLIAWPAAWYTMHRWLESFAYKTSMSWTSFLLAGLLVLGIAMLAISSQAIRAARTNPVEALRYE